MNTFSLEILTPDRQFFSGEVECLILPILDGEFGVLAGHEPVVTIVEPGILRYKVNGEWQTAAVTSGIAEVMQEYTILLLSAAERPEEIDIRRAEAAKERAEDRLRQKLNMQEYHSSKAALARAMARLKTSRI
ncbi:MAG: synthase subunit epsilon [Evtepia sp.]|jgi:F-type H+-transporting ATPase subunit epsilon|nr:synthase subunit epsilon [Evtepia sp.]